MINLLVILELNPYVRIKWDDLLDVELSQCEMYVRCASGRYIGHIGPLSFLGSDFSSSVIHTDPNTVHSEK